MEFEFYKEKIIRDMNNIGTYKDEFIRNVENLAQMYIDMDNAREMFKKSGGNIMIKNPLKNGKSGIIKNPYFVAIENLQSMILTYNRELGLTPIGFKRISPEKEDKNLDELFSGIV